MEGRILPAEKIILGNKTVTVNEQADWGREATREQVISAVSNMFCSYYSCLCILCIFPIIFMCRY